MITILKLVAVSLLACSSIAGIYDYNVPRIEGGQQSLSAFQDKKLMVILLPVEQSAWADSLLYTLDTLAQNRSSQLKVVAVPAMEDGFTQQLKDSLQTWYRSKLGEHVIITDGLYTRRNSASQQHGLFRWLTDKEQNGRLQVDAKAPGYRYMIHPGGELYAALHPSTTLWGSTMQRVLNTATSAGN